MSKWPGCPTVACKNDLCHTECQLLKRERPGVHPVEKLWREVGLPEWFLGNGGTNLKLYELYDRIAAAKAQW